MKAIRQRWAALVFWALVLIVVEVAGGEYQGLLPLPLIGIGLEVLALAQVRRFGEAAHDGWLSAASLLLALTAVMFLLPTLIEEAFGDRVYSCLFECGGSSSDDAVIPADATNLAGYYLLMYLAGLITAVAAIVAWVVYWVRRIRRRPRRAGVSQP